MAGAARPGPDLRDGRVPCPLCGGLLHPIAGKCKHCKADLTAYRTVRPAASAPLPALNQAAQPAVNGWRIHAAAVHAVPAPPAASAGPVGPVGYDAAQPVLPPRPPTRAHASQPAPPLWRSWPIFVIVVATMAIVAAVVLMAWPAHGKGGKRALQPPPAPERMDTQTPPVTPKSDAPRAPQGSADPWGMRVPDPQDPRGALDDPNDPRGLHGANGPDRPNGSQASIDRDPADPADPDFSALDPFGSPHGSASPRRHLSLNRTGMLVGAMQTHLCQKWVDCGHGDARTKRACSAGPSMPDTLLASCPAARRCLERIDAMTCAAGRDLAQMRQFPGMADCLDAMRC